MSNDVRDSRVDRRVFWAAVIVLLLLTRVPAMAEYLSIDNVNLAFSLENFDPRLHQPQPPGYPFFVAFARLINLPFQDAETTFVIVSLLTTGLCLPLTCHLGRIVFAPWVGTAAVMLLLFNPVFWHSSLDGPLRPSLALFSLLTALCAWRCWNGETRFALWGAIALGAGTGFRPDLGPCLFPLWLLSAWMGSRSIKTVAVGIAAMSMVVFVWAGALAWAVGGVGELYRLTTGYLVEQSSGESILMGAVETNWLRQVSRLVMWNGIAVLGCIWALPLFVHSRERVTLWSKQAQFFAVWLLPGLTLQALIHVAAPGHTLFSVPALCIGGAYLLYVASQRFISVRDWLTGGAVALNVMMFLNFFALPPAAGATTGGWQSVKNAAVFSIFETSLNQVRWLDDITRLSLQEVAAFTPPDRASIIVTTDVHVDQWFMNWRIGRYYLPEAEQWILAGQKAPTAAERIRRHQTLEKRSGAVVQIPVPRHGRVLWILEPNGAFYNALKRAWPSTGGGTYVFYTDLAVDTNPFRILNFEFVPTD